MIIIPNSFEYTIGMFFYAMVSLCDSRLCIVVQPLFLQGRLAIALDCPSPFITQVLNTISEVRHAAVVAPIAPRPPAQRLPLGPADLAGARVDVALELGRRAADVGGVHGVLLRGGDGRVDGLFLGLRLCCCCCCCCWCCGGLGGCGCGCCCGVGGRRVGVLLEGGGYGGSALEALEFGLLVGGQAGRGRPAGEG